MNAALLSIHVLAAVLLVGPITVAASLFPRYARGCLEPGAAGLRAQGVVVALHRITRSYAVVALVVPVFGLVTAVAMGVLLEGWVLVSIAVTLVAAVLLALGVLPAQRRVLAAAGDVDPLATGPSGTPVDEVRALSRRLAMITGWFALTWVVVVVLMIARPGSSTGL